MSTPTAPSISTSELHQLLTAGEPPRLLDVRTPGEFESAHIANAVNAPLDVVRRHGAQIAERLGGDVVLVCRTGQRASQAEELLRQAGVTGSRVLTGGIADWEDNGYDVDRGVEHWELERQVRLVAGSIVLSSVVASIAVPKLKWLAAGIGGGLTFAAVSNTCAMGTALSKLPYNRGPATDTSTILSRLGDARRS